MDANNVISLTNNLQDLEEDMKNWLLLTYDERKRADIECINRYNCNNIELYNSIKANLIRLDTVEDKQYLNEDFHVVEDPQFSDLSMEVIFYKIQTSQFLQKNDPYIVIINDFISDTEPDYDLDQLVEKYNKYILLSSDYKSISNDYSIELWGRSVSEMYNYMKQKLLKGKKEPDKIYTRPVDKQLIQYESEMRDLANGGDFINYSIHKCNCLLTEAESKYESTVLNWFADVINYTKYTYKNEVPQITPYFTYDEYKDIYEDADILPIPYIFIENQKAYYDTIIKLQESNDIEKQLKLGWNPAVKITAESIQYAREKQIHWLNTNEQCKIVNLSNYSTELSKEVLSEALEDPRTTDLKPVYIVLSYTGSVYGKIINKYEKSRYSHAGLSLTASLNKIYSFNVLSERNINGFSIESLDDYNNKNNDANILVCVFFVPTNVYKKLEANIEMYKNNQTKTKYSWKNIARIVLNKSVDSAYSLEMVCSQFVDSILKLCDINIIDKNSNLVAPGDFEKADNIKFFVVFEGYKKNYKFLEIEDKVAAIIRNRNYNQLNILSEETVLQYLNMRLIEGFNIDSSNRINPVLKSLKEFITPEVVIQEFKTPVRFNDKGDLTIDLPKNLQAEYDEAHKLLYMYDQTNVNGMKHELARLFYLNSIIEKKLKKVKKEDSQYKELIDLRARILNDYTTFFKVVVSIEPDFDFSKYLKSTEYYNKSVKIDGSTLKYSGSYIKKAIQSLSLLKIKK